jgi:hypothetical protein
MSEVIKYLTRIGSKGGKATGDRKKRPAAHYKAMAAKSAKVRKAKKRATDREVDVNG